eukprot:Skav221820  [mRNA]  locus=scaffold885:72571:74449:+ [translate_table: standard]
MRRGHRKAIEARILRLAPREGTRWSSSPSLANAGLGRSSVKRSVNRSSRRFEKEEMSRSRKLQSRQLRNTVLDACAEHRLQQVSSIGSCDDKVAETYLCSEHAPLARKAWKADDSQDLEVASTCTTATGSDSDSDISMHLHMQSCRSPWEAAVLRASLVASCYAAAEQKSKEQKSKESKVKVVLSKEQKYLAALSQEYSVDFSYDLKEVPTCSFEKFRSEFFYKNASQFLRQLQPLYRLQSAVWNLRPTPVSDTVQKKFLERLESKGGKNSIMVFHGTNQTALPSIYSDGLVVPGLENQVRVANGSAYGVGIYAGKADHASISWAYARGEVKPMLVCAAWDGTAEEVYHHANFNVFKTNHSVVPLFEASLPEAQYRLPATTNAPAPAAPARYVVKKRIIEPEKPKGPGPRTRIPKPQTCPAVVIFLSRRAARKRQGTSWCG